MIEKTLPVDAVSDREASAAASRMSRDEAAALVATFSGWTLDGMNAMAYSLVLPALIALWHLSAGRAGLLGTSALVVSSLGGWLAGMAADRYGRVRILQLTILWFACFTFLSGFSTGFWQLMIARALQGLGFGGEWAVGAVLIGETIRSEHRGKAVGFVQSGWAIGWGLAAISYTLLFLLLPQEWAWRALFWIGILPSLLVFYIGRRVREPEIYRRQSADAQAPAGIYEIFRAPILKTTLLASLVALGAQGGYYAVTTWLPLYLNSTRGLSIFKTGAYLIVIIAGSLAGYLVSAWMTDKAGRKITLAIFAAGSFVVVCGYMLAHLSNRPMLLCGFPLGFFPSGSFSPIGAFFTELFPTRLRGSGQGFSYNLGRGLGALFPALVGFLSKQMSLGFAIAAFAGFAYLLMTLGVMALPETRGLALKD
jgi:MFS family permease